MTVLLPGIGAVVLVGLAAAGVLLAMRQNAYRRLFHYDPRRNCEAPFNCSQVETHSLRSCGADRNGTACGRRFDAWPEGRPQPRGQREPPLRCREARLSCELTRHRSVIKEAGESLRHG